ncbi:6-pyruvoyl-tetrahydropterin synthase-related protein [Enterococcus sp. AZ126]|uniref:6-pyruvoyl-tetrahydropterin synthase-related protein n=1 Tax=Enterococcus sp. AZ126 TaxID=2774635 RepID=UPI003F29C235
MKKWIKQYSQLLILLSFFVLSVLSLYIVYIKNGHIMIGDDYHFHQNRIEGLAESLRNGLLLPKVSYFFIGGYGYASSLFYPDFYLYLPAILRVFNFSLATSFVIFAIGINIVTFILTYVSGRYMGLTKIKSYLFSLLYTLSIYRLQDFFNRQAIGELLAMSFFPLVLASLYLLKNGKENKWLLLTVAMTGIGLAHFISLEIISIFIGMYILLNSKNFFKKEVIVALLKAAGVTVLLLAFYLVPVFEQMHHVTFQVTSNPLTSISDRSYSLSELIANSFKNSVFHASSANIGVILLFGLTIYTVMIFKQNSSNRELIILALLFMFMTTNLFPWQLFDNTPLNTIQFPWRFLSIVTLLLAFLIANDSIGLFKKFPSSQIILVMVILIGVGLYEKESIDTEGKRILSRKTYDQTNSYYIGAGHEYLPKEVDYATIKKNKDRKVVYDDSEIEVADVKMNFDSVAFDYRTNGTQKATVTVPFIYYYGYQAQIVNDGNKKTIPVSLNRRNGLVDVQLSKKGSISIVYHTTLAQKISLGISVITLFVCVIWKVTPKLSSKFK